jgi:hypothetical protein
VAQELFLEDEEEKTASPPYISFLTFTNCLDWLKTERVPHRFDRSFWSRKYSGSSGPQLITALRFLGLLQGDVPQPALEELVNADEAERKRLITGILKNAYKSVDFSLLERATSGMLREWMSKYPLQGTTQQKAMSFLINALKYVSFPLSPGLQKAARNKPVQSATASSSSRNARKPKVTPDPLKKTGQEPDNSGHQDHKYAITTRNLTLNSGGEVTLKISVNLFDLSEDDREFVMGLVDAFRDYEIDEPEEGED